MGWVKIDRQLFDHWLWENKPFSKGQAWIDLIGLANYKDGKATYKGNVVTCQRGTVYRSISYLSRRWGWSRDKTRRFLDALESDRMVRVNTTVNNTAITIENYGVFQDSPTANKTVNRQHTRQRTDSKQVNERKKVIEGKESKEIEAPPSLSEDAEDDDTTTMFDGRITVAEFNRLPPEEQEAWYDKYWE